MNTIPTVFLESIKKYAQNPFMLEKINGKWVELSYKSMYHFVEVFTLGLSALGIKKGDRVSLISEGRNDWVMSELSILCAGAINVPISVRIEELNDLQFRLHHSESKLVIVSGRHAQKVMDVKSRLPFLEKILILDDHDYDDTSVIKKDDVLELGKKALAKDESAFLKMAATVKDDDIANICYTSGTTADPKGIMLSHRNYTANLEQACELFEVPEYYTTLLILPWDHAFGHTVGIYMLMYNGASMASVEVGKTMLETTKNVGKNIKEIKPYFLLSVPALARNFKKGIENGIKDKGKTIQKLFNYGVRTAIELNGDGYDKPNVRGRWFKSLIVSFIDKMIFRKVRANFGGNLLFMVGGGALLDIDIQKFFYAIGMPMHQGYGLTEAAPIISSNTLETHKMGSSGRIPSSMEVKICDENGNEQEIGIKGEIVVKGENVMKGYWKNEEATNETIKDGWLYTGDMGYLDRDGFLYVLGRFKSLLIGSDGEKFSPEGIEESVVEKSRFIDEIVLINNQHPYTSAMIVINKATAKAYLKSNNLKPGSEGAKVLINKLKDEINHFREDGAHSGMFPSRWLPATFSILDKPFTQDNRMMNASLKMVRNVILSHYSDRLDYMYTTEGKEVHNEKNYEALLKYLNE